MGTLFEQGTRRLLLETPLGKDKLLLESFSGSEEMSRPFAFDLGLLSQDHGIRAADLVGQAVGFSVHHEQGAARFFHGHVVRFVAGSMVKRDLRRYQALVVPWLWFLGKRANCRIFQGKTVLEIAEQLFEELGFSDYDSANVRGQLPKLDYCVQYRESDLAFLSRLFEEAGIYFFFRHEEKRHVLVLSDSKVAYADCPEKDVPYSTGAIPESHITRWEHGWQFVSGAWAHADYNFETPLTQLRSRTSTVVELPGTDPYEVFEYPGRFPDGGAGDALVRLRMEEEEAGWDIVEGDSNCKGFTLAGKFRLKSHECAAEENKEFVLIALQHSARDSSILGEGGGPIEITNSFRCIPAAIVYRAARITLKPVMHGPQTAVVVGPSGEEIYTDKYGRIKVQFHWDREGKGDEKSSCWIRVAQAWAGKNWGVAFHPRIGQEVVVEFLDGDPDRPLITGSVYNADQTQPYELPANQTQSVLKTRSTKEGDSETFNELRFEDKKDSELIYLHAQKNQEVVVENDQTISVGHDRSLSVGANKSEDVKENKTIDVGGNHGENIAGEMSVSVAKNRTLSVSKNLNEDVGESMSLTVTKDRATTINGKMTLDVSKDVTITIQGAQNETVTKNYVLKAKKIQIEAEDEILIKSGSASIHLKKSGDITIKGGKVKIEGSGDVILKGSKIAQN